MKFFFDYFENIWIPKYKNNIINYNKISTKERTNNSLEAYHGRLQFKLTKYIKYKFNLRFIGI